MYVTMLKSKLHHARVIESRLAYEGSCSIDIALMKQAHIHEYEQIQIYNLANGHRFTTYAIRDNTPGMIAVNGAAAHLAQAGDQIILCTYVQCPVSSLSTPHAPRLLYLDAQNKVSRTKNCLELPKTQPVI